MRGRHPAFCQTSAALVTAVFLGRALLLRIQPKCFELPIPFRRSITQPFDVDAWGQAALDGSADQLGSKKRERDGGNVWTKSLSWVRRICAGF